MTVADRIKMRREALGMSQDELAQKLGLKGRSSVCKAEKSGDTMTSKTIMIYAKALDCTPAFLMGWTNEPGNEPQKASEIDLQLFSKSGNERLYVELSDILGDVSLEEKAQIISFCKFIASQRSKK